MTRNSGRHGKPRGGQEGTTPGDEEGTQRSLRSADQYNVDMMLGEDESQVQPSLCELIFGRPSEDEPKLNCGCMRVSKRVIKNVVLFTVVIAVYVFFLSIITGGRVSKRD